MVNSFLPVHLQSPLNSKNKLNMHRMKKLILVVALLFSGFLIEAATAQVQVYTRANIGSQPIWGPVGYDAVQYYYLPDIGVYYNVPNRLYYYEKRGHWVSSTTLPSQYKDFDMYRGYKVVINEPKPYRHDAIYKTKYAQYKGQHNQEIIRNSHDAKYFVIKDHPEHSKWQKDNSRRKN